MQGIVTFEPMDADSRKCPQACFCIQTPDRVYYLMTTGVVDRSEIASVSAAASAARRSTFSIQAGSPRESEGKLNNRMVLCCNHIIGY